MKMVSTLALAAVLTLGVASPAMAQKPPKPGTAPAAPKFELSGAFRKAGTEVEKALNAGDWAGAATALTAAEAVAKNDDERYYTSFWRMRIEVHNQNRAGIIIAADALIANPKTPPEHLSEYYYKRAQATFYIDKAKRGDALPYLLKARELGSAELDLPFMLAQIYDDGGKTKDAVTEMAKAIDAVKAAGRKPDQNWYEWAFARVYKAGDRPASTYWMMRIVTDFPTLANWRRVIILYRDSVDAAKIELTKKERLELYRMMRATGALVDQGDYFNYAQFTLEGGLPWETIAVINEGVASGKIPKGDADFAKMLTAAQTAAKNDGALETLAAAAKTGKESTAIGDAFLASGNPTRALALYDQALTQPGVDVNVTTLHRASALVALGRKDEAKVEFAKVTGTPLGDIAKLWLAWLGLPPLS